MAELHAFGVAAVFAADAQLDVRPGLRPFSTAIFINWPTPAWSIEANGFFLMISSSWYSRQERAGIVAAHAQAGLRQVVGAEAEELGVLGDLVGDEAPRGISIIVPTMYLTLVFFSSCTCLATRWTTSS